MTFRDFFDQVETHRLEVTVYTPADGQAIEAQLELRNASVEVRSIPDESEEGFLILRDRDGFVGALEIEAFRAFFDPSLLDPFDDALESAEYRPLFELFEETLWSAMERRQLLATAREIENRAWRVGHGTLRVGFQRLSAYRDQIPVYETLGRETNLDVHVYGRPDWDPPTIRGVSVHQVPGGEIGEYWFLIFDGGRDEHQACSLLAEERSPGSFAGFWSYDPDVAMTLGAYVRDRYE